VSVCSRRPEVGTDLHIIFKSLPGREVLNCVYFYYWQQDADTLLEPSQSGTTCDQVSIKKLQKKVSRALDQLKKKT